MFIGSGLDDIANFKDIDKLLADKTRVILVAEDNGYYFVQYPAKRFGKNVKYPVDLVLPVVHGTNEEDGALQGYLKTVGVPFAGCDVTASAVGMGE